MRVALRRHGRLTVAPRPPLDPWLALCVLLATGVICVVVEVLVWAPPVVTP